MEPLRFIHTADLHLDSPFRALAETAPALRDRLQAATIEAFGRIIDYTIESNADFLVIAGDLYDSKDRSLRALVHFRKQMERLAERQVPAFVVHGNHDPLGGWGSEFQFPPNVITFSGQTDTQPFVRRGREVARITGVSYTRERVTENLASSFRPTPGSPYSIAVLHANVGGQPGHAAYAPATLEELARAGFDYWALGHVHASVVLATDPATVAYPGNPQGRNPRERGARGCFQVDVGEGGRARLQFVETNVVRWDHLHVSIAGHTRMDSLIAAILDRGRSAAMLFDGPTIARCTVTGNGQLHRDLQHDAMAEELREQLQSVLMIESVRIATGPDLDLQALTRTETMIGDFIRLTERALEDREFRDRLAEQLLPLFRRKELKAPDDAKLCEWIRRAGTMGADLLME